MKYFDRSNIASWFVVFLTFVIFPFHSVTYAQKDEITSEDWPVGVIARYDDHGAGIPLETALKMGVSAIQLKAPFPDHRTKRDAKIILDKVSKAGVQITSMQSGFTNESYKTIPIVRETVGLIPQKTRNERIEQFKSVCDFARELNLNIVCFHIGFVPHDSQDPDYIDVIKMTQSICDYAKGKGQRIHLETGQEPGDVLLRFIEDVDRDNLFINFDPANMILYGCDDPIITLKKVGKYVKSCHCKDALWADHSQDSDSQTTKKRGLDWGTEVPFGQGDVNAELFLQTLKEIGFKGALIVERENKHQPEKQQQEAKDAVVLIEQLKAKMFNDNISQH
ncbi:MAG: sugar phosphate isomerase/epimerase family protein [Planctomycetia bacterium]|nr:sugar phosphate isomerase/epimerase family protein [Planctomycetia bacterium]